MESAPENLAELFDELNKKPSLAIEQLDGLATTSLKILRILINDERLVRDIASDLALILGARVPKNEEETLMASLGSVEMGLPKDLRGFSTMLAWVLDEASIRKDPEAMLSQLSIDAKIAHQFSKLCHSLSAYLDLEKAWVKKAPGPRAVLFLFYLKGILERLWPEQTLAVPKFMKQWLDTRVKSHSLSMLYQAGLENLNQSANLSRELMLVRLCLKAAQGGSVTSSEDNLPALSVGIRLVK